MKEYQRKIAEGLNLLIEGLLDDTKDLKEFVGESEKEVLKFRMDEIKEYLVKAEKINYFPRENLTSLKLKYDIISSKINKK